MPRELKDLEKEIASLLGCHLLGAPDGGLWLSPNLETGHVFIGTIDGVSLLVNKKNHVQIHSITYSRQERKTRSTGNPSYCIVFYPPGVGFPIDKIRKKELTLDEAAGVLGVSLRHLFRLIANGDLKPYKKGTRKLLASKDILQWAIKSGRISGAPYIISEE